MAGKQECSGTRAVKALVIVVILVCCVPLVDAVLSGVVFEGGEASAPETPSVGLGLSGLSLLGDPFDALDEIEAAMGEGCCEGGVPHGFEREIGLLPGARDVRVAEGGAVVGYVVLGGLEEVFEKLTSQMEERGFTSVSMGGLDGATFVKSSGVCSWALVTCNQVGSSVSVVVRCVIS